MKPLIMQVDADYFETWFTALCETVLDKYGPNAMYIMDGARSHKRRKDLPPSKSKNMKEMRAWLAKMLVPAAKYNHMQAVKDGGDKPPKGGWKTVLHGVVKKKAKEMGESLYECVKIAVAHQAIVHWTPPYHPELQVRTNIIVATEFQSGLRACATN